jgi:hypothetical protein
LYTVVYGPFTLRIGSVGNLQELYGPPLTPLFTLPASTEGADVAAAFVATSAADDDDDDDDDAAAAESSRRDTKRRGPIGATG